MIASDRSSAIIRLDISIYAGKILCPFKTKGNSLCKYRGSLSCIRRSFYPDIDINDIYEWIISESRINITCER